MAHENQPHLHQFFANEHCGRDSQIYGTPHNVADTEEISALRKKIADGDDYDTLMALADKLGFQLRYREAIECYHRALVLRPGDFDARRKRAPRLFSTQQLDRALADYDHCDKAKPEDPEILYRLGITQYALGRDFEAEHTLARCARGFANNPEMLVAASYWFALANTRTRSGETLWRDFDFSSAIGHHTGYRDALAVLCETAGAEETYRRWKDDDDTLNAGIVLYGLSRYFRRKGDDDRADLLLRETLALEEYWAGFACAAAWAEKERYQGLSAPRK